MGRAAPWSPHRADGGETALKPLSPREVQARVRAGEAAEVIAAETGWPIDKVTRYAGPPLAERAFIAQRAQQIEVRRTGGPVLLADAVATVLGDASDVTWDAYRRDDGRWIVTATLPAGDPRSSATWSYDTAGPNLHPLDEPARWLMGVSDEPIIDFITETPVPVVSEPSEDAVRPHLVAVPSIDDEAVEPEPEAHEPQTTSSGQTTIAIPIDEPPPSPAPRKPKAKGRRASVPSWDEILFGASRGED